MAHLCAAGDAPPVEVGDLLARLDRGDDVTLLDVRNSQDSAAWTLEARRAVRTVQVPYFDFIEDPDAAVAQVPDAPELVVFCARGDSSELIVDILRQAGRHACNLAGGMVAYGEHLQPIGVPLAGGDAGRFELWQVQRCGKACLSYVIRAGAEAIVVDPSRRADWYASFASRLGCRIVRVLDTHIHADHVSGGPALARRLGVPYSVAAGDGFELKLPAEPLPDGSTLSLGGPAGAGLDVRVLHTPGHTPGSASYLLGDRHLLTGDTLFVGGVGRPDLGGLLAEWGRALFDTFKRLGELPDDTVILPAHYRGVADVGPDGVVQGRLGDLRRELPELRLGSAEDLVTSLRGGVRDPPKAYAEIVRVNLGLQAASPETISEWELGKNQCAAGSRRATG